MLKEFYLEPFSAMTGMRRMMDSFFDSLLPGFVAGPLTDVYEKDGTYTIECALPGYTKDEVKVEAKSHEVLISASMSKDTTAEKSRFYTRELRRGSFSKTVAFAQEIDPDSVGAVLENGILKVVVKPLKPIASKTIPVG